MSDHRGVSLGRYGAPYWCAHRAGHRSRVERPAPLSLAAPRLPGSRRRAPGRAPPKRWRPPARRLVGLHPPGPELLDDFFALTPVQKLLLAQLGAAVARAGPRRPVPGRRPRRPQSGRVRAELPTPRAGCPRRCCWARPVGVPLRADSNRDARARFAELLATFLAASKRARPAAPATVGIVYPTEVAGDFGLIRLYQGWCQARGRKVVLGSPFNLRRPRRRGPGPVRAALPAVVRHYKTDWWTERLPIWADEDAYPDPEPLDGPLAWSAGPAPRRCAVVNPFAAVWPRTSAPGFLWERNEELLPRGPAGGPRPTCPQTVRLETVDPRAGSPPSRPTGC